MDKYQEMREKDATGAEEFKKKMTERFQRTVQALEEESQAEKRQLQAMHQQRVISRINQVNYKVWLVRLGLVGMGWVGLGYFRLFRLG